MAGHAAARIAGRAAARPTVVSFTFDDGGAGRLGLAGASRSSVSALTSGP
jgi:hypothetical protein